MYFILLEELNWARIPNRQSHPQRCKETDKVSKIRTR